MVRNKLENYLKTIYQLQTDGSVQGKTLAEKLNVSRPTVSLTLRTLEEDGYLYKWHDRSVSLTPKGRAAAEAVLGLYSRLYDLLVQLGVEEETAAQDACHMEHTISEQSLNALTGLYSEEDT